MLYRLKAFFSIVSLFSFLALPDLWAQTDIPTEIEFSPPLQAAGEQLKIRKSPAATDAEARNEFQSRIKLFERYLAKQVDPYTGEVTIGSRCKKARAIESRPSQLSQSMVLQVSAANAIDCYGDSPDRRVDNKQFLYCTKSKTIYEIDYYYDRQQTPKVPVAHCR